MMDREEKKGLIKKRKDASDQKIYKLSEWEKKYITAMNQFIQVYPNSTDSSNYRKEIQQLYASKNLEPQ